MRSSAARGRGHDRSVVPLEDGVPAVARPADPPPQGSAARGPAAQDGARSLDGPAGAGGQGPDRTGPGRRRAPRAAGQQRHGRGRLVGTVVMVAGGALAVVLLATELAVADLGRVVTSSSPGWFVGVLVGALLTFLGASTTVRAVSPVALRPVPTVAVQVAGTFVNLLGPAGLGGMALNVRYLARRGAGAAAAVAAVVAVQATSLVITAAVVVGVVLTSGRTAEGVRLLPGTVTLVTAGVLVVAAASVLLVRPLRARVVPRVRGPLVGAAAALRDLARAPERLVVALLGSALVTGGFLLALAASLRAYGTSVPLLELAVVLFAGTAVGSLFPTPGGVGAVEAAITGGLVAVGVPAEPALLAAVTYRVATLWLWVVPGWVLTLLLRRAGDL